MSSTRVISVRNVNQALEEGLWWLHVAGKFGNSRNGPVLVAPGPVITEYSNPTERVLFSPARDANPFFHFFESLWMLAGKNDLASLTEFNSRFTNFSDDGKTLHGAYGYRWRKAFGFDQIDTVIQHIQKSPQTRRAVVSMWDPTEDLDTTHNDIPCNTTIYFNLEQSSNALEMTVLCRSNDTILGCHGANAVHFSYLQEYVALSLGVAVGTYRQFSNNYHVYTDTPGYPSCDPAVMHSVDRYATGEATPYPLFSTDKETFDKELQIFLHDTQIMANTNYTEPFFSTVARPLVIVWKLRKAMLKDYGKASEIPKGEQDYLLSLVESIAASDWRIACKEWITRRSVPGVT